MRHVVRAPLVFLLLLAALGVCPGAAADGGGTALKVDYKDGFRLYTEDGRFLLRLRGGLQFRYTYVSYDHAVKGNEEDYSNFYLRRARLWWDGHVYDPRLTYYFHLQLEPQSAVNLHDAWVEYRFSDLVRVGAGRNKIAYGLEFMNSGFALDFIDRSVMDGETDIERGGGGPRFPGGGTAEFGVSSLQTYTGFSTGGMDLYRSQGVQLSGRREAEAGAAFDYQVGIWQGRGSRGASNFADRHLLAIRAGYYPFGFVDWTQEGDLAYSRSFLLGVIASAYDGRSLHDHTASGAAVSTYGADDRGADAAFLLRYRGFSADGEYAAERYHVDRNLPGDWTWNRRAWRMACGYFVVPRMVEVVGRWAQIERLVDPTSQTVTDSGLGFASVWDGTQFVSALEKRIDEVTLGLDLYFGLQQRKLLFDVSRLTRAFAATEGRKVPDQKDTRFRSMFQLRF